METPSPLPSHTRFARRKAVTLKLLFIAGFVLALPGRAYAIAATASSLLMMLYSAAILRAWSRAALIAVLLGAVHGVLFVVLRMDDHALLAGTGALFATLAMFMCVTRKVDWHAHEISGAQLSP